MKCPIYGKEASIYVYYCARCAIYLHEKCWQKHMARAHKD